MQCFGQGLNLCLFQCEEASQLFRFLPDDATFPETGIVKAAAKFARVFQSQEIRAARRTSFGDRVASHFEDCLSSDFEIFCTWGG